MHQVCTLITLSLLILFVITPITATKNIRSHEQHQLATGVMENYHPHMNREIEWVKEEIQLKPLHNGVKDWFCCRAVSGSIYQGGLFVVFGGLFAGLPLGFFIPLTPYFTTPDWIQAECTSIEPAYWTKSCGKGGCKYLGQVKVSYTTSDGTAFESMLYSGVSNLATLYYNDAVAWVAAHQPYNVSNCYYNPNNPSQLTVDRTVPWYLYLYAVFIVPFSIIGFILFLIGAMSILVYFGQCKEHFDTPVTTSAVMQDVDKHIQETGYVPPAAGATPVITPVVVSVSAGTAGGVDLEASVEVSAGVGLEGSEHHQEESSSSSS